LAYQGGNHCELATSLARLVRSGDVSPAGLIRPAPRREGPLRIGFVSKLFGDSTVGNLTIGLIEGLARRGFAVSVFTAGQAGSSADLLPLPGVQVVKMPETISGALALVARSGLDVLFYPDLGIDPFSYTLAFSRLAPVQCTSWGHPVTSGIPEIDYYVSSRLIEPEGATGHYSEELVLLESLPTRYRRPCAPGKAPDRGEFSLPADVRLYVCPQGLFKFHPDFDDLLKEILTRDPQGRLIIVDAPCRRWTQALLSRWSNSLGSLSERVQVMPGAGPEALLKLLKIADVVLDPLHFCGGNVSLQALGLSVPVVTLPGAFMRGQITAGCYKQMGLSTCIASDRDGYVELACRIAGDREFRQHVSAEIENCSAQLFENNSVVDELARFLQVACTRCQ
jgi:predicted O-linked N-acetylglucosamine transferase (SPINDLY family)